MNEAMNELAQVIRQWVAASKAEAE